MPPLRTPSQGLRPRPAYPYGSGWGNAGRLGELRGGFALAQFTLAMSSPHLRLQVLAAVGNLTMFNGYMFKAMFF